MVESVTLEVEKQAKKIMQTLGIEGEGQFDKKHNLNSPAATPGLDKVRQQKQQQNQGQGV
ncbi:MAG: hypothetical protein RLN62_05615 [Rickettsiales bacterium]